MLPFCREVARGGLREGNFPSLKIFFQVFSANLVHQHQVPEQKKALQLGGQFFCTLFASAKNKKVRNMIRFTTETATIYQQPQGTKKRTEKQKENAKNLRFQVPKDIKPEALVNWYLANIESLGFRAPQDLGEKELQEWLEKKQKAGYNGYISQKTAREVTRRISNLLEIAPAVNRLVTFVTLTLPSQQKHSDNFVKRYMLGEFLEYLQKEHQVKMYIWKAEAQKNGNIHFHIMADSFLDNVTKLRIKKQGLINKAWNAICAKYGYLDSYKQDRLKDYKEGKLTPDQVKWHKAFKFSVPNSTDVHKLKSKTKPEAYIVKYIAKPEPDRRAIEGRLIGSSDILKGVPNFKENENNSLEGFNTYYALEAMQREHPKDCKKIYIDSDHNLTRIKPYSEEKIIIEKYYYPPQLWKMYAPESHKKNRKKHFKEIARTIYA
jgi:hypothetical protein